MGELRHVLLVEDEPDLRELVRLALSAVGRMEVTICADGQTALETFNAGCHDLVLLDVMMPGMDGPETLRRLRLLPGGAAVPAVFLTARTRTDLDGVDGVAAAAVIAKPFDPLTLAAELQAIYQALPRRDNPGGPPSEPIPTERRSWS
ncbi:response regulator [Tistrella mobilis]|jgi:DNA-binding response OmpR family regulator|uniref:response regulator n=1 Tax=Tistrella mobilis TaxID=171437 RepID=UPI003555CB33